MTKRNLDPATEIRKMKTLARDLWIGERVKLIGARGSGYARYSDKRSAGYMRIVVENLLLAGAAWSDIERGVKNAASDPRCGPWDVFDRALAAMSERESEFRIVLRNKMENEIKADRYPKRVERVTRGLRSIGEIVR